MMFKRCGCENEATCAHPFHYSFVLHGKRHQGSTKTSNVRTAERIVTKRRSDALNDVEGLTKKKKHTMYLSVLIEKYVAYTATTNKTSYKDALVLKRLVDLIGDEPIDRITTHDIERWKTARAKQVKPSTVNRELMIIRACFRRAIVWNFLIVSPVVAVEKYRINDIRTRVLDAAELGRVLALPNRFVVLMCRTTLETLGRLSEVRTLHKSAIRVGGVEYIRKGGKRSLVPLSADLRNALLAQAHPESGYIFGEGPEGVPPLERAASSRIKRALIRAGIHDATHHTFRHTGTTLMLDQGRNARAVQVMGGWGSLSMLERYGHVNDAEMQAAGAGIASYLEDIQTDLQGVTTKDTTQPENPQIS